MATKPVFPRVHVLVVCDDLDQTEPDVFILTGVRTQVRVNEFPYTHRQFCVYLQTTGHAGLASCRIVVVDARMGDEIMATPEREIAFRGPLYPLGVGFRVEDCTFPEPGLYYVQVHFDGKICGERMLFLTQTEVLGNGQEEA